MKKKQRVSEPLCGDKDCLEFMINSHACSDCDRMSDLWLQWTGEGECNECCIPN